MPGGRTKFSAVWLSAIDSNGQKLSDWCKKGKDDYHGYCNFCGIDIKCDNSGKAQLLQHCTKKKHQEAVKHSVDTKQSKLFFPSTQAEAGPSTSAAKSIGVINYGEASSDAEIYWIAKMACNNYSLRSVDHIGDLFRTMFPDSKVASNFSLSRTSASYIISEGMAPYFTRQMLADLRNSDLPFCVHFDETTTTQVKKQMDLTVRYWSPTHNEVWVRFYTSLFFSHAEGVKVVTAMYNKMQDDGIQVDKMLTLIWDGPNVNKTIFQKMNELISGDHPEFKGLIDLGSCTLHTVHNAFGKGIEQYGKDIDNLCMDLHTLFKYSAARREDYKDIQIEFELPEHAFQQHTEV